MLVVTFIVYFLEHKIYGNKQKKLQVAAKGLLTAIAASGIVGFISYTKNTGEEVSTSATQFLPMSFYNVGFALVLLVMALIPVYCVGRYIYNHDFDKEPKSLLIQLFLAGLGSIFVTIAITVLLISIFPFFGLDGTNMGLLPLIPYIFIGVALIEEFAKWIFTYNIGYNHREFNHVYDVIVYAAFVALGFAAFENILYVFSGLQEATGAAMRIAAMRSITAIPGHAAFGVIMGYYLALAKIAEKNNNKKLAFSNKAKSIIVPTIVHGIYNYLLYATAHVGSISFFLFVIFIVFLFKVAIKKIKQLAALGYDLNMPLKPQRVERGNQYKYCPNCGKNVLAKYCQHCGYQHKHLLTSNPIS